MGGLLKINALKSDYSGQNAILTLFRLERCPMKAWQMQEAKARLSEVVKCADSDGPQNITLHGQSVAVVMSRPMFDRLTANNKSLVEFMQSSPLFGANDIHFDRDTTPVREVSL